ncbi:hypothetical protein PR048_006321 [Dryococelus australis]|uniref:Ribosomal protein S10 n=1 Tax=Dryococelus australis TaxID=614101 RepID=A0ABQ9IBN9_9NEOP|nr:hypothetical protein PR048_006321 [Dryococelus australis]
MAPGNSNSLRLGLVNQTGRGPIQQPFLTPHHLNIRQLIKASAVDKRGQIETTSGNEVEVGVVSTSGVDERPKPEASVPIKYVRSSGKRVLLSQSLYLGRTPRKLAKVSYRTGSRPCTNISDSLRKLPDFLPMLILPWQSRKKTKRKCDMKETEIQESVEIQNYSMYVAVRMSIESSENSRTWKIKANCLELKPIVQQQCRTKKVKPTYEISWIVLRHDVQTDVAEEVHHFLNWSKIRCLEIITAAIKLTSSSMREGLVRSSQAMFALFFSPPDKPRFRNPANLRLACLPPTKAIRVQSPAR